MEAIDVAVEEARDLPQVGDIVAVRETMRATDLRRNGHREAQIVFRTSRWQVRSVWGDCCHLDGLDREADRGLVNVPRDKLVVEVRAERVKRGPPRGRPRRARPPAPPDSVPPSLDDAFDVADVPESW